jgi:biopolymer transport protein ExbB/TolQ
MDWRFAAAQHAAERAAAALNRRMARGLDGVATVAATAPLVGTVGTVSGIADSLSCPGDRSTCLGSVTGRLSEALVLLALGLAVGIAASWCYRYLTARMTVFDVEMRHAARILPDQLAACVRMSSCGAGWHPAADC